MGNLSVDFIVPTLNINPERIVECKNSILTQKEKFKINIFIEKGSSFTKSVNRGIRKGKGQYVALINDDVILTPTWLDEAIKILEMNKRCAAVATRVLSFDGVYIDSCGMDYKIIGRAIKRGNGLIESKLLFSKVEEVFGVPCSAALFKREPLIKAGLFDEKFYAYLEDVDLSFRLRLMGYTLFFAPKSIAFHLGEATSSLFGNLKSMMDARNWFYIIVKNYPLNIIKSNFDEIFLERLKNLSGLIKDTIQKYGWRSVWVLPVSVAFVFGAILRRFPKLISDRKKIQNTRKIRDDEIETWMKD
ncbi:hypothetical protein A2960_00985 [Candidatus Gottesmanbacteria bacterium RIFCSPLOWO2_01_FULL_39_12b]|uniref:Glycosyltransferase 2-like domain-containing protein n=1 Tax=Candidatus Gottesmanbacteria bacterium RIFCSPLOWO2_01_FULL_39_12b TaxID=1798388 RepID=A0A1F6APX0_9BACT|nr:MAG: hypothetical protein A2960_00985 [Candidatus Gottesmanbacteria bacterium RIFCSPLOWO2_01_FULL_39_12b]